MELQWVISSFAGRPASSLRYHGCFTSEAANMQDIELTEAINICYIKLFVMVGW